MKILSDLNEVKPVKQRLMSIHYIDSTMPEFSIKW